MPTVDTNRLKGNFGAAYVSACLSSECLVRPVAAETDVGIDLYCETIENGSPFLHFWVQVKAGAQCRICQDQSSAACSFDISHLSYWYRQPVPVFAALVPVDWPVAENPIVYVIDVTSRLLAGVPGDTDSLTLESNYIWRPGIREDVKQFLAEAVPTSAARLRCRNGVVGSIPTLRPKYEYQTPLVPVTRFKVPILHQIRTTAALSILFLRSLGELNSDPSFRRILASIIDQFGDDPHWENFMARALSYHADERFPLAVDFYNKAKQCIENDSNVSHLQSWQERVKDIERLRDKALRKEGV
jgi:hypothetical protein